jgi:chaperonin GroEL
LGPKGRNAVLDKALGPPTITKHGATVAKEIGFLDPYEKIGSYRVPFRTSWRGAAYSIALR